MPNARPIGDLPFMDRDSITGFPLSQKRIEYGEEKNILQESGVEKRCLIRVSKVEI